MRRQSKASTDQRSIDLTGRTIWDIVWNFSRERRTIAVALCVVSVAIFAAVRFGWLDISWDSGFKLSLIRPIPEEVAERITGYWTGTASDNTSSGSTPVYRYTVRFKFSTKGRTIYLDGDYDITNQSLPRRILTGSGEIRDDYARLTYEYRTEERPGAIGYGVMLLHIPPSGDAIHGSYSARAMQDDTIKSGTLELSRSR